MSFVDCFPFSVYSDRPNQVFSQTRMNYAINAAIETAMEKVNYTYQVGRNLMDVLDANNEDDLFDKLHEKVSNVDYEGLNVGDYMQIDCGIYGTRTFEIADFDPYWAMGSTSMGHHICFVDKFAVAIPTTDSHDGIVNTSYLQWNTTATNQGTADEPSPYMCSNLHDWEINNFLPALPSALQDYLIDRWEYLETRYSASGNLNASTGWAWKQLGKVWSLSEMEVYGATVWGTPGYSVGISRQLAYYRNSWRQLNGSRTGWWLRAVSGGSSASACGVGSGGVATGTSAANTWTRPRCGFLFG